MKYLYLPLILLLIFNCKENTETENSPENHLRKLNLNGKVKSIKEISFQTLLKNGKIIKGDNFRDLPISDVYDYLDSHDFLINIDKAGRITDYTFFEYDGQIFKRDTCQYYSTNDIEVDPAYKIAFLYKKKNNNSIEYSEISNTTYHYDKQGNLILIDYGDLEKTKYKYDKNNNIIEEKVFDENGELSWTLNYEYKYDNHQNWIEKLQKKDNQADFILERKIEYYK